MASFSKVAKSLGNALQTIGTYSANSAAKANNISAASQSAQGTFNQASADNANALNMSSIANQYGYNSAMMQSANEYNTSAWERAAAWNEEMWKKQAEFNASEAQKNRDWQTQMANTQYQRAMADMEKAGLNPILAYGGVGGGVPGGSAASVSGTSMGAASANMASGGLLGASTASEGNYMGQMEQMGTTLALLGAIFAGISSAADAAGELGGAGQSIMDTVVDTITDEAYDFTKPFKNKDTKGMINNTADAINSFTNPLYGIYSSGKKAYHYYKNNGSKGFKFLSGRAKG